MKKITLKSQRSNDTITVLVDGDNTISKGQYKRIEREMPNWVEARISPRGGRYHVSKY